MGGPPDTGVSSGFLPGSMQWHVNALCTASVLSAGRRVVGLKAGVSPWSMLLCVCFSEWALWVSWLSGSRTRSRSQRAGRSATPEKGCATLWTITPGPPPSMTHAPENPLCRGTLMHSVVPFRPLPPPGQFRAFFGAPRHPFKCPRLDELALP